MATHLLWDILPKKMASNMLRVLRFGVYFEL